MDQTEVPPFAAPSEFALSLQLRATPDILTQDGFSQATVVLETRGPDGQPQAGVPLVLSTSHAAGSLSRTSVTTGSDGRATVLYTAPLASPFQAGGPSTLLTIYARPVGSNYSNNVTQHVDVLLMTPPVPTVSANGPTAQVTYAPAAPKVGDNVLFDASGSYPGTGHQIVYYYWNFGDSQPNDETGPDASHTYVAAGTYTMTLGVVDEVGQISSTFRTITVAP
jgi:PKD repeat protein